MTAALSFAVLIPLGWLQYRWISELAEASEARGRADLRAALERIGDEMDRAVVRTHGAIVGRRGPIGERIAEVRDDQDGLPLGRVLVIEFDGGWSAQRWSSESEALVPADVPAWWLSRHHRTGPIHPDPLAVIGPLHTGRERHPPPGAGPPPGPTIVAEIDSQRMREEFLPKLLTRQFGPALLREYSVRIIRRDQPEVVIHLSGETAWQGEPDVSIPIIRGIRRLGPPGRGPGPDRPPPIPIESSEGIWLVQAKHVEGGIGVVFARTRARNLAVSLVTLALLGTAILLLTRTAKKDRELANLRMEFTAGVSHELRSPLAVIVSAGENLASGIVKDAERVKEYGEMVRDQGGRLNTMVDQVLRFSALESAGEPLELRSVEASGAVRAVEAEIRQLVQRESISLTIEHADGAVRADGQALHAALRNLAENAIRHGGDGKWLRIAIQPGEGVVKFLFEDKGPGIAARDLSHIFEPFYRGAGSRAKQLRGSGLGLALVSRIAAAHGGRVTAENCAGGGARFVLTLPAA